MRWFWWLVYWLPSLLYLREYNNLTLFHSSLLTYNHWKYNQAIFNMSLLYQIIKICKYSLPKMSLSSSFTNPRFKTIMVHIAKKRCMSMFIRKKRRPTHLAFTYSFKNSKGINLHKVLTRKPQNYKYHLLGLRLLISTRSICSFF